LGEKNKMALVDITMYGADWCGDCRRSKRLLEELDVQVNHIDVEADKSAAAKVIEINGGAQSIPVIVFPDGTHLTEPSDNDLKAKLTALGII
jgi:mycoredoxin